MLIIWLLQQWDEFGNTVYLLCVLIACRECVSYTSILCTKRYSFFYIKIFRKCGSVQIVFLYCWIHVKKLFSSPASENWNKRNDQKIGKIIEVRGKKTLYLNSPFYMLLPNPIKLTWLAKKVWCNYPTAINFV